MKDISQCSLLVVDDTEANLDILVEALGDAYNVAVAMDGRAALEAVQDAPPDLILLDIMMPGMDGYQVCQQLKADDRFSQIPVIFLTAMTEVANKTKGFALGAVDYITKPFEIAEVQARVETHLKLRQALAELESQNQMLKDYARLRDEVERMTHHDLKTPLNAVISVPAMLLEEHNLTQDQRDLLGMLQESGHRMLHLINSSLDLYKMEIGRYQLRPEPVEVLRLIRQIWAQSRELAHAKRLQLNLLMAGRPVKAGEGLWVWGEETLIYSLLANLIKNAVEASPEDGSITITLAEGEQNLVRIHNQGEVPEAMRDKFFDKFATAGKKGGTGLGTYTAKLISPNPGRGHGHGHLGPEGHPAQPGVAAGAAGDGTSGARVLARGGDAGGRRPGHGSVRGYAGRGFKPGAPESPAGGRWSARLRRTGDGHPGGG